MKWCNVSHTELQQLILLSHGPCTTDMNHLQMLTKNIREESETSTQTAVEM
jgi:hypothetical protein